MWPFGTENLRSNKPDLYFGAGHEACWLLCGLERQAELCDLLLTLEVTKYGNAISQYWTPVKHMVYNQGIMKIFHLDPRRDSINPRCICYL